MLWAAVPAKDLENAKQRLIPILSPSERRELARSMLEDVLAALGASGLDAVSVVTRDPEVAEVVRSCNATILEERENLGHSAAVALAQRHAREIGADGFLTIPGDVPLVTPEEIRMLSGSRTLGPGAVFVPSRSGLGTNAALLAPPDVMPLTFGEPSFTSHLSTARAHGLEPMVLGLPGLGLDIDGPEDLAALAEEGRATNSGRFLRAIGFPARLSTSPSRR